MKYDDFIKLNGVSQKELGQFDYAVDTLSHFFTITSSNVQLFVTGSYATSIATAIPAYFTLWDEKKEYMATPEQKEKFRTFVSSIIENARAQYEDKFFSRSQEYTYEYLGNMAYFINNALKSVIVDIAQAALAVTDDPVNPVFEPEVTDTAARMESRASAPLMRGVRKRFEMQMDPTEKMLFWDFYNKICAQLRLDYDEVPPFVDGQFSWKIYKDIADEIFEALPAKQKRFCSKMLSEEYNRHVGEVKNYFVDVAEAKRKMHVTDIPDQDPLWNNITDRVNESLQAMSVYIASDAVKIFKRGSATNTVLSTPTL